MDKYSVPRRVNRLVFKAVCTASGGDCKRTVHLREVIEKVERAMPHWSKITALNLLIWESLCNLSLEHLICQTGIRTYTIRCMGTCGRPRCPAKERPQSSTAQTVQEANKVPVMQREKEFEAKTMTEGFEEGTNRKIANQHGRRLRKNMVLKRNVKWSSKVLDETSSGKRRKQRQLLCSSTHNKKSAIERGKAASTRRAGKAKLGDMRSAQNVSLEEDDSMDGTTSYNKKNGMNIH